MQAFGTVFEGVRKLALGAPFLVEHVVGGVVKNGEKFERRLLAEHVDYVLAALAKALIFPDLNPFVEDSNVKDRVLINAREAIDFTTRENEVVVGHAWRAGVAVMAGAGSLRRSGEWAILIDDGEAAAVPLIVEATGEQENSGISFYFVEVVQHARVDEAECSFSRSEIDLGHESIAPGVMAGGSPKRGLRIRLRDKEILKEPRAGELVRAELKRYFRRILPEEIAFAGKDIEFAMGRPIRIGS